MIPDGIYKIYQLRHDETDETHRRLVSRLLVHGGQIVHLEAHHNAIDEMFPEGPVTDVAERRFLQLQHSGYYEVVNEADVAAGHHESEVEPLDLGHLEADHKFILTGEGLPHPQLIEMWDDAVVVDGRRLDDTEAHHLLQEVASGRLSMTPLD